MLPFASGFKPINGINLYYELYGEGTPVVLIHGGGGSIGSDWTEVISRLHRHYQVLGIDLQNHGRSDHRAIPETFEQDAIDVVALVRNLGIEKAAFIGFSNGGTTALTIAHLFPQMVTRLVAASALCKRNGMPAGFFKGMEQATIEHMPLALKDNFRQLNPDPQKLQNMFEKDSQRMIHFKDWDDSAIRSINHPVFLIGGDQDVVKPEHLLEMNMLLPQSRLMLLPAQHGNYFMANERGYIDHLLIDFTIQQVELFLNN